MVDFSYYSKSKAFWESHTFFDPYLADFKSLKGRWLCLLCFFKKCLALPIAIPYKIAKTFFCLVGFSLSLVAIFFTLGLVYSIKKWFEKRATALAFDLMDWVLYPFSILACAVRHLLAATFHPKIHYGI